MKKMLYVFLCIAVLFLGSCSDMAPSPEEKYDLPAYFDYEEYAKINKDVAMSQIIFDITEKNKVYRQVGETAADSTSKAVNNCINLLKEGDFARKIYLEYVFCPEQGWSEADNAMNMGACWNDGWNDLESFLQDSLPKYTGTPRRNAKADTTIKMMCMFVPKAENTTEAENYLKGFYYSSNNTIVYGQKFSSELVIQHYFFIGRYDGRPYKYCESGHIDKEKAPELADNRGTYYDYGRYTFCLNDTDQKIYVVK
jgi:hypothetical protein